MIDVVEVLQHWHAGRSKADVAASVGVDRGTVRKYVAPAEAAGLAPGGPPLSRAEWVELVRGWFPELIDAKARSLTYPTINAHRARIKLMLATNTVTTVHQRLRDEHGLATGISSFRRYVWLEFGDQPNPDAVTVWRPPVEPGSEAQIDYGYLGSWFDQVVPTEVAEFGREAAGRLCEVLGDELLGAYFVGSIALGGYVAGESDIDIVAVSRDHIASEVKQEIAETLLDAALACPARGLEFTLYRREVAVKAALGSDFEVNVNGGPRMSRTVNLDDREQPRFWFVLDRAIAHRHGVVIYGPSPADVFADVPRSALLEMMVESMHWHRSHERLGFYSVLNACRAWRFAIENLLGSKFDGAEWARTRSTSPGLIDAAVELRHGRPGELDERELRAFVDHVERVLGDARRTHAGRACRVSATVNDPAASDEPPPPLPPVDEPLRPADESPLPHAAAMMHTTTMTAMPRSHPRRWVPSRFIQGR